MRKESENVMFFGAEVCGFDENRRKVAGEVAPNDPRAEIFVAGGLKTSEMISKFSIAFLPLTATTVLVSFSVVEEVSQINYACSFAYDTAEVLRKFKNF